MFRWLVGLACLSTCTCNQLRFSNVFQNHMVLQHGKPIKVWGFGEATAGGNNVAVCLTQKETLSSTCSDIKPTILRNSKNETTPTWSSVIPLYAPSAVPATLVIKSSTTTRGKGVIYQQLDDIVIGNVRKPHMLCILKQLHNGVLLAQPQIGQHACERTPRTHLKLC